MSDSISDLLNQVRHTAEELDEDTSRNELFRYLANTYLQQRAEKQTKLEKRRKRANKIAGRENRDSSDEKDYHAHLGNALEGESNPYIGSSK